MKNFAIIEVFENNTLIEKYAFNFLSKGVKHSNNKINVLCDLYKEWRYYLNLKTNSHVFYNATSPNYKPNQVKIFKRRVNGDLTDCNIKKSNHQILKDFNIIRSIGSYALNEHYKQSDAVRGKIEGVQL